MFSTPKPRNATYEDYLALPEGTKAELHNGVLLMSPQPKGRHIRVASVLVAQLGSRFGLSTTPTSEGPGGWWILYEPEVHLVLDHTVFVPDLAGWRRERMATPPNNEHKFTVAPDWVCEVLSPSTASRDAIVKMPLYREAGVPWAWIADPVDVRVDVFSNGGAEWVEVGSFHGRTSVRIPPFGDVELDMSPWWD